MSRSDADSEGRKLFIGGLPFEAKQDEIRRTFGKFGDVEDVNLPLDHSGRHKGFCFVTYRDSADCADAAKENHQRDFMGREISAKVVVPRSERMGGNDERRPGDWTCDRCGANVFAAKNSMRA